MPTTWAGQMIGTVCAIFGSLTVALPISVIGGNFSLYYAHVRARLKLPKKNRPSLQVRYTFFFYKEPAYKKLKRLSFKNKETAYETKKNRQLLKFNTKIANL